MFDARARPRAVNPPPREAPASVRVCLQQRSPADEGSPGDCSPARPLPVAPTHCLRSLYRPRRIRTRPARHRGARHLVLPLRMSPPFASSACLVRGRSPSSSGTSATGFYAGREMTPRSHAFCRPSPRTPCGGVASFEARTVRLMAQGLGGGRELGELLSRAAWAEPRRVKGTGPVGARGALPGIPCSPPRCVRSSTLCRRRPGKPPVWRPRPPRLRRPRLPAFPEPREGIRLPCRQGAWVAS